MVGQIVEITDPGHWLNKHRGFLQVRQESETLGQVPLDDIAAIIISVPGCSVSTNLLDHLAQRNVPIVMCGQNYLPSTWTLPVQGHNRQFQTMRAQAMLSEPKRKRAWQTIVKAKITNQADVLARAGKPDARLRRLADKVRSGDPENCEAQAARAYWQRIIRLRFPPRPRSLWPEQCPQLCLCRYSRRRGARAGGGRFASQFQPASQKPAKPI